MSIKMRAVPIKTQIYRSVYDRHPSKSHVSSRRTGHRSIRGIICDRIKTRAHVIVIHIVCRRKYSPFTRLTYPINSETIMYLILQCGDNVTVRP